MSLAQQIRLTATKGAERSHDTPIVLGFSALAMVILIAVYLASGSPAAEAVDFATTSVFP